MRRYRRVNEEGPAGRAPGLTGGAPLRVDRRTLRRPWLFLSILVGFVLAEATVWGWFALRPEPGPSVMTNESCGSCHTRSADDATIFVAVDGEQVLPNRPVRVMAGDPFEVDFHFSGVVGDPARFSRVGMEIVTPEDAAWSVTEGTLAHPEGWSPAALGVERWSPAWDRADNGAGPTVAEWLQSPDRPNAYYLSWDRNVAVDPVVGEFVLRNTVSDRGAVDEGDPDGIAGHSGADALITVPLDAEPGVYHVEVSGIGHTPKGKRANVSATIAVAVTKPLTTAPASAERRPSAVDLYQQNCSGCHGATPNTALLERLSAGEGAIARALRVGTASMRPFAAAEGGPLDEEEIHALVKYLLEQAELARIPGPRPIPHDIATASDCLSCHGDDIAVVGHQAYSADACTSCHRQGPDWMRGPPMVHSPEVGADCLRCHLPSASIGVPATHAERGNETCRLCHTPGPRIPPVPHSVPPQLLCLTCHGPQGELPVSQSHEDRGEDICLACHRPAVALRSAP